MPNCTSVLAIAVLLLGSAAAVVAQNRPPAPMPAAPAAAANPGQSVTTAEVEAAIARGKAFLYAQQRNGNWEESQKKLAAGAGMGGPMGGRGENPAASSQWA